MDPNSRRRKILIIAGLTIILIIVIVLGLTFGKKSSNEADNTNNSSSAITFGDAETGLVELNGEDGRVLSVEYPKNLNIDTQQVYREELTDNYGGLIIFYSGTGTEDESRLDYNISVKITSIERAGLVSEDLLYELVGSEDLQEPSLEEITIGEFTGQLASSDYAEAENGDEYYISTALLSNEDDRYIEFSAIYKKSSSITPDIIKAILSSIETN